MKQWPSFITVLLVVLSSVSNPTFGQWTSTNGPYEAGPVNALHVGPDGKVWVGMLLGVLYSSSNAGQSFSFVSPLTGILPKSILYDKHGCIFVGDGQYFNGRGVIRSTDGGHSWSQVLSTTYVQTIVRDSSGTILVGTRGAGLFRSVDDGLTWLHHDLGDYRNVLALGVSPQGQIFASVENPNVSYRVLHSNDNGWTWDTLTIPWRVLVSSFAFGPGGRIAASFGTGNSTDSCGFLVSTSNGASWSRRNVRQGVPYLVDTFPVIYDESTGAFIAGITSPWLSISTPPAILRSIDQGRDWATIAHVGTRSSPTFGLSRDNRGNLFAGEIGGMSRSTDGGFTWTRTDSGFTATGSGSLTLLPGKRVYTRTNYSVFRLDPNGVGWTKEDSGRAGCILKSHLLGHSTSDRMESSWRARRGMECSYPVTVQPHGRRSTLVCFRLVSDPLRLTMPERSSSALQAACFDHQTMALTGRQRTTVCLICR